MEFGLILTYSWWGMKPISAIIETSSVIPKYILKSRIHLVKKIIIIRFINTDKQTFRPKWNCWSFSGFRISLSAVSEFLKNLAFLVKH